MATAISTNNTEITLTIGAIPIKLTHFSAEGDIWVKANDPELGGSARTPDGKLVVWAKNDLLKYTLTLNGGSPEAHAIINAFQAQMRTGSIPSVQLPITVIVSTDSFTATYIGGIIETGAVSFDIGQTNILDLSWTFSFEKVITLPK